MNSRTRSACISQTIGYLKRGQYSPSLYVALRIAEFFEVLVEVAVSVLPFPESEARPAERTAAGDGQRCLAPADPWPDGSESVHPSDADTP